MAPSRGSGFNGQLFFLYDREAVTKEGDPPENAIIYFYPASASVESKVSICGQLVGVSNFLTTVLDFAPVLIKLKMEKVALCQSGKYTIALGGSSTEPESLLLRQLNALFSVFSFYHGSFDNVKKFSKDHVSFLSNMTIIWDCYLPFIRYYGDTLPAVFDPLPFLKTPKNSSGCFLKASHILEACQRRRHVLGGCILYKKSVLCTQLEPCITRRLLLFKPNQSHHPAKQVKTEINLPFGVRILHSFLTLQEYERLMKELSRSPYNQNVTSEVEELSASCAGNDQEKEADSTVGERFHGLLHKSVRRRIESESEGLCHARDTPKKVKPRKAIKQRTGAEGNRKERSVSTLDKEDSRSTLKHESPNRPRKKEEINEVPRGNQPLIDPSSKNQDEPLPTEDSPVEFKLEQEEHKPDKLAEVLPNVTENTENVADQSRHDELCTTTLPQDKEKEGLLGNETSYPTCSNGADATTRDGYFYNSSSSGEDELTMDEVDVKNLRIITYSGKEYISYDIGRSEITSMESKEVVKEVCFKVVNELIEQVVSETEKGSTRCFQSGDASFHALPQDVLRHCSVATEPCEGQPSETKQNLLIINGHESQSVPSGLDLEKPINNGLLCDSADGSFVEMPNGQHSGVVTARNSNCNYSSNEDKSEQNSEKIPVGVSKTVPTVNNFVSNTPKLENIDKQENDERILTSVKTEETQSNGTHYDVYENPEELLIDTIPTGAIIDSNDTSPNDCKWSEDVPMNSSSLGARTGSSLTSSKDCEGTKESYTDSSAGADVDSKDSSVKDHERPMKIAIDSPSAGAELDLNETSSQGSPGSEYHDSFEDLVTDGARSEESFLEESNSNLFQEYKILEVKDDSTTVNKYSTKNLNLPEEKHFEKMFFKDIVVGGNDDSNISSSSNDADGTQPGEVTPKSLDLGTNGYNKDSRSSNGLSGNDTALESLTPGYPGDSRSTLGDSGLCLLHEAVDNPGTKTETEAVSNPNIPQGHHGDSASLKLEDGPNCSSEEEVANQTKETNDDHDIDHKVDFDEEMDDNAFQVDGMVHLNLYVQAHSNTVLILLAEDQLHRDHETIKALWKTSLNELGELEVRLNQCHENLDHSLKPEDYSYLVYDGLSNTTKGNLNEPVLQVDHMFCDTAKTVHEQFNNCSSLRSVTLRNSSSAVHCQRSLGQEVYFHKKGSFRSFLSSLSSRDPAFNLEKRASKLLHKNHGVNVF